MEGHCLKRKRHTDEDLEHMQKLGLFLDSINQSIDPFTTNDIEIPLNKMLQFSNSKLTAQDCRSIYNEFIISAESSSITKIADLKKDFNLNWSKHEISNLKGRFSTYTPYVQSYLGPVNTSNINDQLSVLRTIRKWDTTTKSSRDIVLKLATKVQDNTKSTQQNFPRKVELQDSDKENEFISRLSSVQKLDLVRHIQKYGERFDKLRKSLVGLSVDCVVREWSQVKRRMRREVAEKRLVKPSYTYGKWLKAEIRLLLKQKQPKKPASAEKCVSTSTPKCVSTSAAKSVPTEPPLKLRTLRVSLIDVLADATNKIRQPKAAEWDLAMSQNTSFKRFKKNCNY